MLQDTKSAARERGRCDLATMVDPLNPTIFHEQWWLDAATDGRWREATVESGGRTIGRLPYLSDRKFTGQVSIVMPRLTRSLGPAVVSAGDPGGCVRLPNRHKIVRELIGKLPRSSHLWMQMHGGIHDVMTFEEAGCSTTVRYTTEIAPDAPDRLWAGMRDKTRNVIRRSQETHLVDDAMTPDGFLAFYAETAIARGRRNDYSSEACGDLITQAIARQRGRAYAALNAHGEPMAAIMTVWDVRSAYYLMSARRQDAGNGAVSMLLWSAMQDAAAADRIFDGDGLSKENYLLLTGLGGVVRPRYLVSRTAPVLTLGRCVKQATMMIRQRLAGGKI